MVRDRIQLFAITHHIDQTNIKKMSQIFTQTILSYDLTECIYNNPCKTAQSLVLWMTTKKPAKTTFFARECTAAETQGFVCGMEKINEKNWSPG